MRATKSLCGRFVMLDGLHLDREVFERLERWAHERGLQVQDAVQLALCAFGDDTLARTEAKAMPPSPARPLDYLARARRVG